VINYYEVIMDGILSFFSLSKSSDATQFLCLKGLRVEVLTGSCNDVSNKQFNLSSMYTNDKEQSGWRIRCT